MPQKTMRFEESTCFKAPARDLRKVAEAFDGELPLVIFSEIHAITANWITRNFTYYPTESLLGNPNDATGVSSFVNPYAVPIIRDHISSPGGGFFGPESFACEPYGRVYNADFIAERNGGGWVRAVAAITDPWAISMVLSGRFLTVSIGGEVSEVYCSVCTALGNRANMVETGRCDHMKGEKYDGVLCYWLLGPLMAREISFVNIPSDFNARVVNPNLEAHEARTLLAGSDGEFLFDMASGRTETAESYRTDNLGISRRVYRSILEKARKQRVIFDELKTGRNFQNHLDDPDFLKHLKSTLKGL